MCAPERSFGMLHHRRCALLVLVLASGCPAPAPADGGTMPASDAGEGGSITLSFGPEHLAVGEERTVCIVVDAGNDVARQVRAIHTTLPVGSHHMIVSRTDRELTSEPFDCSPFEGGAAVFIAETRQDEVIYPADAALELAAHQHVAIEVHEVNYTEAPIDVTASVTFELHPLDGVAREPVEFLFTGNPGFVLPARMTTTIESEHGAPEGARIFGITSHTHSLGRHATIHRSSGALLHESEDWSDPPLDTFDPPLVLEPGEQLELSCEFENTRDVDVPFGLGFADEMCFLWAYYY
jgi:hypothetical protein